MHTFSMFSCFFLDLHPFFHSIKTMLLFPSIKTGNSVVTYKALKLEEENGCILTYVSYPHIWLVNGGNWETH